MADARTVAPPVAALKLIGWNCRGKGKSLHESNKMEYLAKLMYSTGAQVTFVSETRSSRCTSTQLNNRFNISASFVVPSVGLSGGLWLLWSDEVSISVKFSSSNIILALVVHIPTSVEFVLVCVYGDPHHRLTKIIWEHIFNFVGDNLGKPVVCLGDFNNIMYDMDTSSVNLNYNRLRAFNGFVKQCGLFDLGFSGPAYTWTNKRFNSKPVFERLDRCLANAEWCDLFPNTNVLNLPIILSDHAPILASTESKFRGPWLTFKFENWWALEEDFQTVAKNAWSSTANRPFHTRAINLAGTLKKWCKKKSPFKNNYNLWKSRSTISKHNLSKTRIILLRLSL